MRQVVHGLELNQLNHFQAKITEKQQIFFFDFNCDYFKIYASFINVIAGNMFYAFV